MVNGKPHVTDPLTGKLEDATKYTVSVDHILPQKYFTSDPRFNRLPKEVDGDFINGIYEINNPQEMLDEYFLHVFSQMGEDYSRFDFSTWAISHLE